MPRQQILTEQLPSAIRWEQCRAQVLESWGRKEQAADARFLADAYFQRLQEQETEDTETTTPVSADGH